MGNCCETCSYYHKPRRNITLLVVGLDNAGKSTMAKRLAGEPVHSVLKTLGFSLVVLHYRNYQISLFDLGGSPQIRDIWSKYFIDAHGIIYVVDSSDLDRLEESKRTFADVLAHKNVAGKPVLLLANKQDVENTLDELEIVEQLDVERVVNRYRCLTRVEICSALSLEKYKIDFGIRKGFRWLIENIVGNYQSLNERVQRDMTEFAAQVELDRNEWRARVEAENSEDSHVGTPVGNGNPFQPIDQVIENINGCVSPRTKKISNGVIARSVLIDNYVQENSSPKVPDFTVHTKCDIVPDSTTKTDCNIPNFTVKTAADTPRIPFCKNVETTKRPYSKHKRKFARFNRTAPMPIDALMQDNANDLKQRREVSKYSIRSEFIVIGNEFEVRPRNYLTRRPLTAPSKFNLTTVKVNRAWNLSAPLDVSASSSSRTLTTFSARKSSKIEDAVSYF